MHADERMYVYACTKARTRTNKHTHTQHTHTHTQVVALQAGEATSLAGWKLLCEASRKEFQVGVCESARACVCVCVRVCVCLCVCVSMCTERKRQKKKGREIERLREMLDEPRSEQREGVDLYSRMHLAAHA